MGKIYFILPLIGFIIACTAIISQDNSEDIALQFVKDRVKFYAENDTGRVDLPLYSFQNIVSTKTSKGYDVKIHVTATLGNDSKEGIVLVSMDDSGKVTNLVNQK